MDWLQVGRAFSLPLWLAVDLKNANSRFAVRSDEYFNIVLSLNAI